MRFPRLRWGRIVAGGVMAELCVFAVVFPVLHFFGQSAFLTSILVSSAVFPFLFAFWATRRAQSHFVVQGMLVGVVAALVYLAIARGQPEPLLYKIAHGLKVVGGLLGGVWSARNFGQKSAS